MSPERARPLAVRGLTVRFGSVTAVDGLGLAADSGAVVGLVGPNGCGKTTTLRAVMGLVEPAAGDVRIEGFPARSLEARSRVAWVPDEPTGLDELTVAEFLAFAGALYRADRGFRARAETLLAAFGLEARRHARLGTLSHGLRRIAAVVAAAALDRPLLVVDEATAALDPDAVAVLRETLRALAYRGAGVVVATQDLHFAEATCDRVVLLSAGRVVAAGGVPALRGRYAASTLEDVYLAALGRTARLRSVRDALASL